jgi:drug/metabolite transporter (DMT)-like permease
LDLRTGYHIVYHVPMKADPDPPSSSWVVISVYTVVVLIWGTTWLSIRISLDYLPPTFSIMIRFIVAGATVILIQKLRGEKIPLALRHQPFFIGLGLLGFVLSYGLVYWAEQYISSGLTAVLFGLLPLLTGILAHRALKRRERLDRRRLLGLMAGLLGIVVINSGDLRQIHPLAPLAAMLVVVSSLCTAVSTVLSKSRAHIYSPLTLAGLPMLYGGLANIPLWLITERNEPIVWTWEGIAATAYLTFFGSVVTYIGYFWLLRRMEVSRANLIAYLTPIIALAVGFFFADETITPGILAGAALIFGGVAVANRAAGRI